MNHQI